MQFRMRSACSCIVCDHINLHTNSQVFSPPRPSFLHPLLPYLAIYFLPFFLFFFSLVFFFFFSRSTFSAGWVRFSFISFSLLVAVSSLLFAPRTFGHPRTPTNLRWFLLNPLVLYSNWFKLSRSTSTSACLCRVVLSTALVVLSLIKRFINGK